MPRRPKKDPDALHERPDATHKGQDLGQELKSSQVAPPERQ